MLDPFAPEAALVDAMFVTDVAQVLLRHLTVRGDDSHLSRCTKHVEGTWREIESGGLSGPDALRRLGFKESAVTEPLFAVCSWLDLQSSSDQSVLRVATKFLRNAFIPAACPGPLIGSAQERRLGQCIEQRGGADGAADLIGYHADTTLIRASSCRSIVNFEAGEFIKFDAQFFPPPAAGTVRLYHGTSRTAATNILSSGVDESLFSDHCDFGRAFYMTPSFQTALSHAARVSYESGDQSVVIMMDITVEELASLQPLDLQPDARAGEWIQIVTFCRRQTSSFRGPLRQQLGLAKCIIGPMTSNAPAVNLNRAAAPSGVTQYAFRAALDDTSALDLCNRKLLQEAAHYVRFCVQA